MPRADGDMLLVSVALNEHVLKCTVSNTIKIILYIIYMYSVLQLRYCGELVTGSTTPICLGTCFVSPEMARQFI